MSKLSCIADLLAIGADGAIAIGAPGRTPAQSPMTFAALRALAGEVVDSLNRNGIGRGDRVAIVLPNGPEMAVAFMTVAAGAVTAPLNPAYREDEFNFYLDDLKARALIVQQGDDTPARAVAQRRGIDVLELVPDLDGPAGGFRLQDGAGDRAATENGGMASVDDPALILHTSGTTSRPKIVPLSQKNLAASARNISATLGLTSEDRCMNIMPLFHIHGLIAAVLTSLSAGASVYCTPGFNALKVFSWLEDCKPVGNHWRLFEFYGARFRTRSHFRLNPCLAV